MAKYSVTELEEMLAEARQEEEDNVKREAAKAEVKEEIENLLKANDFTIGDLYGKWQAPVNRGAAPKKYMLNGKSVDGRTAVNAKEFDSLKTTAGKLYDKAIFKAGSINPEWLEEQPPRIKKKFK